MVLILIILAIAEIVSLALPFLLSANQNRILRRRPILFAKAMAVGLAVAGIVFSAVTLLVAGILATVCVVGGFLVYQWARLAPKVLRGKIPAESEWFEERIPTDSPTILLYCATRGRHATNHILAFLDRLGSAGIRPVVVVRRPEAFIPLARKYSGSVWFTPTIAFLDKAILPGFQTMLYLRNVPLNGHAVRFSGLRHVLVGVQEDYEDLTVLDATHALYDHILFENAAVAERLTQSARPDIAGLVEVVEDSAKYLAGEQT
jgi:hypothetical protein